MDKIDNEFVTIQRLRNRLHNPYYDNMITYYQLWDAQSKMMKLTEDYWK